MPGKRSCVTDSSPGILADEGGRIDRVVRDPVRVALDEQLQVARILRGDPPRDPDVRRRQPRLDAVLVLQPVHHDVELQRADRSQQQRTTAVPLEDLDRALLAQLLQSQLQLLRAHRIGELDALEHLGREERQSGELQVLALGERIAELQRAPVRDADDVARPRHVEHVAPLRQEGHHGRRPDGLAVAHHLDLHAALEAARAHPGERDAVAVGRIHVRLDLEHDRREGRLGGLDQPLHRAPGQRRRRKVDQRVEHFAHAEAAQRGAEEHGRLVARRETRPARTPSPRRGSVPSLRRPARTRRRSALRTRRGRVPAGRPRCPHRRRAGTRASGPAACRRCRGSAFPCRPAT